MLATRKISNSSDDCDSEIVSPKKVSRISQTIHEGEKRCSDVSKKDMLLRLNACQLEDVFDTLKYTIGISDAEKYQKIVYQECIDGECFSQLGEKELREIGFDPGIRNLLLTELSLSTPISATREVCRFDSDYPTSCIPKGYAGSSSLCPSYGCLVTIGHHEHRITSAQGIYPTGKRNEIFTLNRKQVPNGVQIDKITIGEERSDSNAFIEDEYTEDLHTMVLHHNKTSTSDISCNKESIPNTIEVEFCTDDKYDMFQIGRYDSPNRINDVVVRGLVLGGKGKMHEDAPGRGTVSRVACRLMCERSTGKIFIYAGGFDAKKKLVLSASSPQWIYPSNRTDHNVKNVSEMLCFGDEDTSVNYEFDGLLSHGIRVFFPDISCWREVSIMGKMYDVEKIRQNKCSPLLAMTQETNELTAGCIIDIGGGVCFIFRKGINEHELQANLGRRNNCLHIEREGMNDPPLDRLNKFLDLINRNGPRCPVLMNTLHFPPKLPDHQHAVQRIRRLIQAEQDDGFLSKSNCSDSGLPVSGIENDQQPYIFTACGHCFGFDPAFNGKSCPMCRQRGPYTPLLFPFSPGICTRSPTHVFHPCGHAASYETCLLWSRILLPDAEILQNIVAPQCSRKIRSRSVQSATMANIPQSPACPFCAVRLEATSGHYGFSKIVLLFENTDVALSDLEF